MANAVDDYAWGEGFFMSGTVKDEVFHGSGIARRGEGVLG